MLVYQKIIFKHIFVNLLQGSANMTIFEIALNTYNLCRATKLTLPFEEIL